MSMPAECKPIRVGLVGLGRMGAAILPHLVSGCSQVTVWNRTAAKSAEASTAGARVAQSPREAAENADVILSILFDDEAVTDVYLGGDGLLSGECAGRVFVEMSTIAPATTSRVASAAKERSASFVDAPVSGTVGPAREGKLLVLAGGSDADLERVRPVLSLFARRVAHLGPVGSGISAKLSLQLPIYVYWQSLAEALAISVGAGLDTREMLDVIADSPAALAMLKSKIPTLLGQDEAVAFALSAAAKDLAIIQKTAVALGVSAPAASVALEGYRRAVQAGLGEADVAQIVRFLLERAGTLSN